MPAAISRAASYSIEFGTRIPCCPSASYTSSSTGNSVPLYSTVSIRIPIRSPSTRVPPTSTVPFGIRRSSTAIGSSRRIRSACPSDTVCVPCTQAAMVFLPEDGILPTGVWKPVFLSPAYPEAMSSLPAGWASDDTIRFCTRFTGRTAVRSFRLFGALAVEEASGSFPL